MSEKAGPGLDAKLAELMGKRVAWMDPTGYGIEQNYGPCLPDELDGFGEPSYVAPCSSSLFHAAYAAEELRKAGSIDAWDIHQFETSSASTGRLNGRTLAWSDAVQGDPDSADPRAHALTLALVSALSAEAVESMKGGRA